MNLHTAAHVCKVILIVFAQGSYTDIVMAARKNTPYRSLTAKTPEKWWERKTSLSHWVSVTFQGRTVKLRGGISVMSEL